MKKHLPLILSAVACLLAAVCLWRIVLLEQAVEEQMHELRTLDSSVVDLQSLPGQVQDALDRSASLLVDKKQSFGKLNTADYTVPMTVTVTPKEQTPGVTTATLVGNGTSYPMEAQKDGSFSVVIPCPLLQTVSLDRVIFMDNGTQRIETLEYEALAVTDAIVRPDLSLQATVSMKEGKLCYEGQLAVQQENLPHVFQTMRIVADIDGKQVKETPIDLDPKFTEEMAQEEDNLGIYPEFKESYDVPKGSTLTLTAVGTDENGLQYRVVLSQNSINEQGQMQDSIVEQEEQTITILTPQGKRLWSGASYELY